ncbi:hypothetical protein ACOSQ3_032745 [Xanthoceras sorbifolium]
MNKCSNNSQNFHLTVFDLRSEKDDEVVMLYSNGGTKLIKSVNFKFVRPLPPDVSDNEHQTLEVNDVVDGYLVDAWWVGVVYEVLEEEPKSYSVLLSSPPDLINFKHSDVRLHLDWVDHKWVRIQKHVFGIETCLCFKQIM